ncbi:zinc finger protein 800a isoform X2 [Megalops cyprinoides]|nr:zinc finger protein 800a isoform X2 [Megalops cyprinoides]
MEKPHSALRKTSHFLRNQHPSKGDWEVEEAKPKMQRTPTKDKYCQTEHHHHGCCEPGTGSPDASPKTTVFAMEPGDPPLLQQQLQTSKSGIQQIIECFRSGTAQLKHILLKEVDTIFECKLCRSLFRGLPNLITHKEFYCFPRVTAPADPPAEDKQSQAIKELLEAIYPRTDKQEYVVRLEPIETNQNAVFQFVSREEDLGQLGERDAPHQPGPEEWGPTEQPADAPAGVELEEEAPEAAPEQETLAEAEEEEAEPAPPEEEAASSEAEDFKISCCLCGKGFNSHRSVQRHCRKMHKTKIDELKKYTETRTVPISLFSMVKGRPRRTSTATGRNCPMCYKSFATKANVRRHFDEVHRGLRRDFITPDIATKPGQPLSLEANPPRRKTGAPGRRPKAKPQAEYSLSACRCLLCKRKYSSQIMLRRHMRIVHKIHALENGAGPSAAPAGIKAEDSDDLAADSSGGSPSLQSEPDKRGGAVGLKSRVKQANEGLKARKHTKLSVGFDFKQLYCKLCKRQFTSKQNLTKHIDLHTDGNDIYIKFYRCPLCSYESRRKRDVIRHITVVHKKSSRYLAKIMPNLESRAVKKPAEIVLNSVAKRGLQKEDVNGRHETPPTSPATRKHDPLMGSPSSRKHDPLVGSPATRKHDPLMGSPSSRKHDPLVGSPSSRKPDTPLGSPSSRKHEPPAGSPTTRRQEALEVGTEVKVTKNFSLHACETCGKAFAKKLYLESHKKSHKTAAVASPSDENKTKGRSTRSKALI